jgi:hypothetical protein
MEQREYMTNLKMRKERTMNCRNWHIGIQALVCVSLGVACGGPAEDDQADSGHDAQVGPPATADAAERLAYMREHGTVIQLDANEVREKAAAFSVFSSAEWLVVQGYTTADSVCMVNGVWGNFSSAEGSGNVSLRTHGTQWYLDAFQGGALQVVCTKYSNFSTPGGSVVYLSSEALVGRTSDGTSTANMYWGDAVTFLTHASGEFEGGAESVHIGQSSNPTGPSLLNVRTSAATAPFVYTRIKGGARSFFIGPPTGAGLVKLIGYHNGSWVRGYVNSGVGTWHFTVGEPGGFSSYWLAPYDNAVCFLSRMSGDLDSSADKVSITKNGSQFYMAATGDAIGAARCMAYNQL